MRAGEGYDGKINGSLVMKDPVSYTREWAVHSYCF